MKKWILLSVMLGAVSLSSLAQDDDMYFVPTKKNVARDRATYGVPADTYYSGSARSVDEYNRRWLSSYEVLPVDTGDIISFAGIEGIYPDSLGDFSLTQRMTRWDGYEPSSAYWAGYSRGYFDSWGWHSPWYYSLYYPWYDPWFYDSYYYWGYGWYDPFYYSWYSPYYYRPWYYYSGYYYGGGAGYLGHYSPGTSNHGRISGSGTTGFASGRTRNFSAGTFGSSRSLGTAVANRSGSYGGSRSGSTTTNTSTRTRTSTTVYSNSNGNFGGSSSNAGSSFGNSRSAASAISGSGSSSSSGGGASFGGSRSSGGGGGGGGTRSGGGGGGFGSGRR